MLFNPMVWIRWLKRMLWPHFVIAFLMILESYGLLHALIPQLYTAIPQAWEHGGTAWLLGLDWLLLPRGLLAAATFLMSFGLMMRARLSWAVSLILLLMIEVLSILSGYHYQPHLIYPVFLAALLIWKWRDFNRISIAAGSLLTLVSLVSLVLYAIFGALWMGADFSPPISDTATAFYFAIVSMSTVGYGDIVPKTESARLFTVSVIVFGITAFATAISTVVGPLMGASVRRILQGSIHNVTRKNHYIIIGASFLAHALYARLKEQELPVTIMVDPSDNHQYPESADIILGDTSDIDNLKRAGVTDALAVLALRTDDAENAFIVLALKEIAANVKSIVLVNDLKNVARIKSCGPSLVFTPQLLETELLTRILSGDNIDRDKIAEFCEELIQPKHGQ